MPMGWRRCAVAADGHRRAIAERKAKYSPMPAYASRPSAYPLRLTSSCLSERQEAFDEHIVHPATAPVHRDAHPSLDQGRAGELAALDALLFVKPRFPGAQK